jgi:hypothetical protein
MSFPALNRSFSPLSGTPLSVEIRKKGPALAYPFCEVRSALLSEIADRSSRMADTAHELAELARKDGTATLDEKVEFANRRSQLRVLIQECEVLHDRMQTHRDEHGC